MKQLRTLMQAQFDKMCQTGKLFRSKMTGSEVWDLYLSSFTEEEDPVFRDPASSVHNCNLCQNFMRRYGNIVAVDEQMNITTLFDVEISGEFEHTVKALSAALKQSSIGDVFFETFDSLNSLPYEKCTKHHTVFQLGIAKNLKQYTAEEAAKFGVVSPGEIREFSHLMLMVPAQFVDKSGSSVDAVVSAYRDAKNVFKRAMDEISLDTLLLVRDLINQGSLLDGETHLHKIEEMIPLKKQYDALALQDEDAWCWVKSYNFRFAKFKNELIGTLCTELSEGVELNKACIEWNKRIDPANYMKATAPITQKQIEEAKAFVEANGYESSFCRRCATIDDIKASEILHFNAGSGEIKNVSVFDGVKPTSTRHKRSEFDKVEEVSIDKFMTDILPYCTSVEAFLLNSHKGNMVTLTTSADNDSKQIFKWSNNYSWTYNGNLAGKSMIKEAIESRGGKTQGCLNIRLHFPKTESDYDLHVLEPNKHEIFFSNRRELSPSNGMLDLDAQGADGNFPPEKRVENVIYTDKAKMAQGVYDVFIHNYAKRDNNYGFTLEVETDNGDVTTFVYDQMINRNEVVNVCRINLKNGEFTITPIIPISESNVLSQELYGLETNQFHKVNLVCLSPNHWGYNEAGNKHYFFMLEGCKAVGKIRSFHNENLNPDLHPHRKVMEVLGATTMIEPTDKQLSGLGFNATVREELILKLGGTHKRIIKVKF